MTDKKRGPGQPALPPEERKSERLALYVTPGEREQIDQCARKIGITKAEYLRRKVLG